ENINRLKIPPNVLRFDQLGDPSSLKRGDDVYLIGNPLGKKNWQINVIPDKVRESSKVGDVIYFDVNHVAPGHSGGALLNAKWEIVGMIIDIVSADGEAINLQKVVDTLTLWGYPPDLKQKPNSRSLSSQQRGASQGAGKVLLLLEDEIIVQALA